MKKKILFTGYRMITGGVSKALLNMLNNLDAEKYDITVILQVKDGPLLQEINKAIKVEGYNLTKCKNKILKKIINLIKYIKLLIETHNKYDFAACYESGYPLSSILALNASKNNACWMHTNVVKYMEYSDWFKKTKDVKKRTKKFCKRMFFEKFKKQIFVSHNAMEAYQEIYPNNKSKGIVCHNIINYKSILEKSNLDIDMKKSNKYTFLNVSRHTEHDKRITMLIEACKMLKEKNDKFLMICVGDGEAHNNYVELVKKYKLENNVIFTGLKINPYPYYKISDCFVLTSRFEGYPVVFNESLVMNIPIITTDVSDAKKDIDKKYGVVVESNPESIYFSMKNFIETNKKIEKKFDYKKFNNDSIKKLEELFESEI